jgi:hypothetical protein
VNRPALEPWLIPGVADDRGYVRIWLGKGHRFAQKSGQQWRHRYVVMLQLDRKLESCEHVHHVNGVKGDDRPENLELLLAEYHGAIHCALTPLGHARLSTGGGVSVLRARFPRRDLRRCPARAGDSSRRAKKGERMRRLIHVVRGTPAQVTAAWAALAASAARPA